MTNWAKMFIGLLIYILCWDTPSENTGHWQSNMSSAFKLKHDYLCKLNTFTNILFGGAYTLLI